MRITARLLNGRCLIKREFFQGAAVTKFIYSKGEDVH